MTTKTLTPTVLIVPGLRDQVDDHWQTLLERKLPNARSVPPLERDKLSCAARVAALDAALSQIDAPVLLVAHSAGVMITVHWARLHRLGMGSADHRMNHGMSHDMIHGKIHGALLATPPDFESPLPPGYPTLDVLRNEGWLPVPRDPLPFPSIVAASTNDPLASVERVEELAQAWGSRLIDIGAVGHLNPAAGYGEWHRAQELIAELA